MAILFFILRLIGWVLLAILLLLVVALLLPLGIQAAYRPGETFAKAFYGPLKFTLWPRGGTQGAQSKAKSKPTQKSPEKPDTSPPPTVIKTVEGEGYRPAMGKTRESLFSMLTSRGVVWEGARVLDLFAGSGSLAFEAVSRGAELAVLVENSAVAARCLADNIRQLGVEDCVRLIRDDVRKTLNNTPMGCFDLVFLDPPYRKNLLNATLQGLLKRNWLAPGALICAEIEKDAVVAAPDSLELLVERHFGQTRILIWTLA